MLTGLIFDEHDKPYTPVFTSKKSKKYRYYNCQNLAKDKNHPDKARSRLPAHEIETVIEKTVRSEVRKLSGDTNDIIIEHLITNSKAIPSYDFVRGCVDRITVHFDHLKIKIKPSGFVNMINHHLNICINESIDPFEISIPYQTKRGLDGVVIIPSNKQDIFDRTPEELKKLVQGCIWREEHFNGALMIDIAKNEGRSDAYVRKAIMSSFLFF